LILKTPSFVPGSSSQRSAKVCGVYVPAVHQLRVVGAGTGGGLAAAVTMAASGVEAGAATPGLARPAAWS
jgi:hypothetical protein